MIMARTTLRLLVLAAVASAGAACVDSSNEIFVVHNQAMIEDCTVSGELDDPYIGHGLMDVTNTFDGLGSSPVTYVATPVVQSRITEGANGQDKTVLLSGANVELAAVNNERSQAVVDAMTAMGLNKQAQYFSASIESGGTTGIAFEAIDATQGEALQGLVAPGESVEVLVRVTVHGDVDGNGVTSPVWTYPITVCNGCRVFNLGSCAALPDGETFGFGGRCAFHSDPIFQCCTSLDGSAVCPAVKTTL
jgi:hypothetical protein